MGTGRQTALLLGLGFQLLHWTAWYAKRPEARGRENKVLEGSVEPGFWATMAFYAELAVHVHPRVYVEWSGIWWETTQ